MIWLRALTIGLLSTEFAPTRGARQHGACFAEAEVSGFLQVRVSQRLSSACSSDWVLLLLLAYYRQHGLTPHLLGEQENTNVRSAMSISPSTMSLRLTYFFYTNLYWQVRAGILQKQLQQAHLYRW